MDLTQEELNKLKASQSEEDWNKACDAIKAARNGQYPPDWWQKVKLSGLVAQITSRWGDDFENQDEAKIELEIEQINRS